jgi:hypothetical protein
MFLKVSIIMAVIEINWKCNHLFLPQYIAILANGQNIAWFKRWWYDEGIA